MFLSRKDYYKLKEDRKFISLNRGSQTLAYLCKSDILIYVGERGTGKTHLLLMKLLPYINIKNYNGVLLRREYGDAEKAGGLVDASKRIYSHFGEYLSTSRRWVFKSGAKIDFINYSDPIKDFRENIQGKENVHAGVDEITHMDEDHFDAIFSNLRNTIGLKTQMIGTCNADSASWIKDLVARYLDINTEAHTARHAKALNGRELYFFQRGNSITDSVWGLSRKEVYENAKDLIDSNWNEMVAKNPKLEKFGDRLDLILSISVFDSSKFENESLMASGGLKYQAKLLKNNAEMRNRYAITDWENTMEYEGLVSSRDLENMFYNTPQRNGERYASMDVGGEGNDKSVIWIWDGFHIENIYVTKSKTATELIQWTSRILAAERIPMSNFVYDSGGLGFAFSGHFNGSMKFLSQAKQTDIFDDNGNAIRVYANYKSQTVGTFLRYLKAADLTKVCGISINTELLQRDIYGQTLRQHLENEKRAICWASKKDGILQTINRDEVRGVVGHSADIMLSLVYRFAFNNDDHITKYKKPKKVTLNKLAYYFNN